jgi:hypothetical protein
MVGIRAGPSDRSSPAPLEREWKDVRCAAWFQGSHGAGKTAGLFRGAYRIRASSILVSSSAGPNDDSQRNQGPERIRGSRRPATMASNVWFVRGAKIACSCPSPRAPDRQHGRNVGWQDVGAVHRWTTASFLHAMPKIPGQDALPGRRNGAHRSLPDCARSSRSGSRSGSGRSCTPRGSQWNPAS